MAGSATTFPHLLAGRLVDGKEPAVERDRDHLGPSQRHTAVVDAAAGNIAGPGLVSRGSNFQRNMPFLPLVRSIA
jgi:hypothetical protein